MTIDMTVSLELESFVRTTGWTCSHPKLKDETNWHTDKEG